MILKIPVEHLYEYSRSEILYLAYVHGKGSKLVEVSTKILENVIYPEQIYKAVSPTVSAVKRNLVAKGLVESSQLSHSGHGGYYHAVTLNEQVKQDFDEGVEVDSRMLSVDHLTHNDVIYYAILKYLTETKGMKSIPAYGEEIGEYISLSMDSVRERLIRLEEAGYIKTFMLPENRRIKGVVLLK